MDDQSDMPDDERHPGGIANDTAKALGMRIASGHYEPGDKLPTEIDSADQLGISRTSYREAMRVLTGKGLLSTRQKSGTSINEICSWNHLAPEGIEWTFQGRPNRAYIASLFEFRMNLEPKAARLAALRRSSAQLRSLREAFGQLQGSSFTSDRGRRAERHFYKTLFASTQNLMMSSKGDAMATASQAPTRPKGCHYPIYFAPVADHLRLLNVIVDQDGEAAHGAASTLILNAQEYAPQGSIRPRSDRLAARFTASSTGNSALSPTVQTN